MERTVSTRVTRLRADFYSAANLTERGTRKQFTARRSAACSLAIVCSGECRLRFILSLLARFQGRKDFQDTGSTLGGSPDRHTAPAIQRKLGPLPELVDGQ